MRGLARNQSGQAFTEYIVMVAAIAAFFLIVKQGIGRMNLAGRLNKGITGPFAAAYKYGNTTAVGYDEGDPSNHPRILLPDAPSKSFRIFINPAPK